MDKSNRTPFQEVETRPDFYAVSEEILNFWKANTIFEKSVDQRPDNKPYIFYDGPPFVTGLPHYGSLLPSIAKDLIPRYQTMKGHKVRRVWGWDCHGLPIENRVENELGLKSRRDIEDIGLERFIEGCFTYVSTVSDQWEWYVDRIGRWVDFKNAYRTMDLPYMESVMWVFKQIYDKGLIYKGKRVSLYCPKDATPISNFEVAMDNSYVEITEPSTTYKYKLITKGTKLEKYGKNIFILAWSTTPWTKLATSALAINPDFSYSIVKQGDEYLVLASTTLGMLKKEPKYETVGEVSGRDLEGLHFESHFDFYDLPEDKEKWVIVGGDFVTDDEGTGVVTLAAYGEEDFKVMQEKNIALIEHLDNEGNLTIDRKPWKGVHYLNANEMVDSDLEKRNLLYAKADLTHTVPTCWRCGTRLYYAPQDAWFIKVSELKQQMYDTNENINWFPKHIKHGRFEKGIETAPDWCISRSRYWATPMPVWECEECEDRKVVGSIAEIEELSGKKVTNLHRPYIDEFTFKCPKCGGVMKRIPEVVDCWLESGSMPYGQYHYPFEKKEEFEKNFPADFVVEYIAQTRAWFYVLHVISNALFQKESFKNVISTGVIRGTDGRKMSKSYGNYPDPKRVIETYGGDALRLYLMGSVVMAGENLNISEEEMKEQVQRTLSIFWNSYKYFTTYANVHNFQKPNDEEEVFDWLKQARKSSNILDRWMALQVVKFTTEVEHYLDSYNIPRAVRLIRPFVQDLSTWYIRRNRERFVTGDREVLQTLYAVLMQCVKVMAPIIPFVTEHMYRNLVNGMEGFPESVHLADWPKLLRLTSAEKTVLGHMEETRLIASEGNAYRKEHQLPARQPLAKVLVHSPSEPLGNDYLEIIQDELNVKHTDWVKAESLKIDFDTTLTQELIDEGEARKLIRQIQEARKKAGTRLDEWVSVVLPQWPKTQEEVIKKKTLAKELRKGDKLEVVR